MALAVEAAQLVCGIATAILTAWLIMRGSLPLATGTNAPRANAQAASD